MSEPSPPEPYDGAQPQPEDGPQKGPVQELPWDEEMEEADGDR